ncbi:MAG: flavodoxin family protein [Nitrospiraceae bacterium]|nr:flavodoxin family protein [Nitrospiraceae bacterium]
MNPIRITGLVASPRRRMNTDTLVQKVLDGCGKAGAVVSKIYLNDLEIQACQSCKVQDGMGCVYRDGMDEIYEIFEKADGLVLGTPVYYNTVSGQMKLMMDRSYCLARPVILPSGKRVYESAVKKRKKGIVVSVGGSGSNPECVMPVFNLWAPEVNLEIIDSVLITRALLGQPPMDSPNFLEAAFLKGEKFAHSFDF